MPVDLFYQQFVIALVEKRERKKKYILKLLHRLNAKDNVRMQKINGSDNGDESNDDGSGKYVRQIPIYPSKIECTIFMETMLARRLPLVECTCHAYYY